MPGVGEHRSSEGCGITAENEQILLLSLLLAAKDRNPVGGGMKS